MLRTFMRIGLYLVFAAIVLWGLVSAASLVMRFCFWRRGGSRESQNFGLKCVDLSKECAFCRFSNRRSPSLAPARTCAFLYGLSTLVLGVAVVVSPDVAHVKAEAVRAAEKLRLIRETPTGTTSLRCSPRPAASP